MEIGTFVIPDMRLQPGLIADIKTMYSKFEKNEVDFTTLASVWGHKNARSGTFTAKKATMVTYGLLEGRGKVHVTEIGRKLAQIPPNPKELKEGIAEAVQNIPLWKELYEKYTKIGKDLPTSDFWISLRQICRISPEEAKNKAEMVRKAYLEDIVGVESSRGGDSNMGEKDGDFESSEGQQPKTSQISKELSFLTDGGLELKLPGASAKEKWEKYKAVIDAYLCPEGTES